MKLELKHLAPYLPYKLNVYRKSGNDVHPMSVNNYTVSLRKGINVDDLIYNSTEYKPILRPLSDLTKEIEVNEEKFVPLGSLLVQKYPKWFQEHQESKKYTNIALDFSGRFATAFLTFQATHEVQIDSTYVENTPYLIFKKLIEWHFDVFGLIENGLAIDINTLNEQL